MSHSGGSTTPKETIQIGDLQIQFPHVPYSCQRDFMEKVVEALNSNTNAALESPTGTGKTLSLLCSAIAWVQHQKELGNNGVVKNNATVVKNNATAASLTEPENSDSNSSPAYYPKIFYASRTHSQLQQVVRELNKTKYRNVVKAATLAGRDQLCLNEDVLKEPNSEVRGLMCRTLTRTKACFYHNNLEKDAENLYMMYSDAARGHAMDIEDLMNTAKKFNHCPFYQSRHMSKRADLILLPYVYLLDPQIRDMYEIKVKGNILIFDEAHNMEQMAEESISVDFSTRTLRTAIEETQKVLTMVTNQQDIIAMEENGQTFASSDESTRIKKEIRTVGEEIVDDEVTEEGEELEDDDEEFEGAESESESDKLKKDVSLFLAMLQAFEQQISTMDLTKSGSKLAEGRVFPGGKMFELMKAAKIQRHHRDRINSLIDRIHMFLTKNPDRHGHWAISGIALRQFATLISRVFVDAFSDDPEQEAKDTEAVKQEDKKRRRSKKKLTEEEEAQQNEQLAQHFKLFVEEKWMPIEERQQMQWHRRGGGMMGGRGGGIHHTHADYFDPAEIHQLDNMASKEIQLHYWCFSAAVAMRYIQSQGIRSILLASGTLAPLNIYTNSMGIPFGAVLESAHCARDEQLIVGTLEKGPNSVELLGTFQNRDDLNYKEAIGSLILQVARVTPQGMLVFFPSFFQMNNFIDYWRQLRIKSYKQDFWEMLESHKKLFMEPKDSRTDIHKMFRDFDQEVCENPKGALLFAVCRGKLSEGIDFADNHCRSVVIVGIPFPPLYDPKVMLKKAYLTEQCQIQLQRQMEERKRQQKGEKTEKKANQTMIMVQNPDQWYKIEGTRAVNQALGRIIRHKDDFGAVILADTRFGKMSRLMFPSWMRNSIKNHTNPSSLVPAIQRFFKEQGIERLSIPVPSARKRRSEEENRFDENQSPYVPYQAPISNQYRPPFRRGTNHKPMNRSGGSRALAAAAKQTIFR